MVGINGEGIAQVTFSNEYTRHPRTQWTTHLAGFLLLCFTSAATAFTQPVLITAAKTINPTDTTITPTAGGAAVPLATAAITVQGATLTVNGRCTIASLALERSAGNAPAILTHAAAFTYDYSLGAGTAIVHGMALTVTGNVTVQGASDTNVASRIDTAGRGYAPGQGPGHGVASGVGPSGGGYGGSGGLPTNFGLIATGGATYGSYLAPTDDFGSGGAGSSGTGNGGGAIRLIVNGTLQLDGSITAAGGSAASPSSGGAGGSIWITAGTLSGAGPITASGGASASGGGGGRIRIDSPLTSYTGTITATGGAATSTHAGAGTIYFPAAQPLPQLIYDNGGDAAPTVLTSPLTFTGALIARNGAGFTHPRSQLSGLTIDIDGSATFDPTATIDISGRGYRYSLGPGAGLPGSGSAGGSGGGYGGAGASNGNIQGGGTYGSAAAPTSLGSGGGGTGVGLAGYGGGALRLTVTGNVQLDGSINADGGGTSGTAGAGSGGSIWISAGSLGGAGTISASGGGVVSGTGTAGGGGRIAIYSCGNSFPSDHITATGGAAGATGAPGGTGTIVIPTAAGIAIVTQPTRAVICPSETATFTITAVGPDGPPTPPTPDPLTYRWQRETAPGSNDFVDLDDGSSAPWDGGEGAAMASGSTTPTLSIAPDTGSGHTLSISIRFRATITGPCGSTNSDAAQLITATTDMGTAGGLPGHDGIHDNNDFIAFIDAFFSANPTADLGEAGGLPGSDGLFDNNDFIVFINLFFEGC